MLDSESEKRTNERLKTLRHRKKKYERLRSDPIKQKEPDDSGSIQQEGYKTLIENIPCAVYSAYPGKAGPTTFISKKWKDWTGYSPEELYRDPEAWPKCIHPDDREDAVDTYSTACRDNVPYNLEYRIVHKETGQVRYVRDQGLLSKDKQGEMIRVDGIVTDISALKQAEKSQQETDEKFRNFLDNLGDIAYETDASGNVTYANKIAEKVTGVPLRDIIGKPFLPLFTKESRQIAIDVYERTLNGESAEYELTFTNGRVCHFKNEPLRDESGQVSGVFGIARDITERKRTENALHESEERFRVMFEKLPNVAVQGYSPDGTIQYWNKANESIYGYTAEEALGKDIVELIIPPEMREYVREAIAHGARTGEMPAAAELNLMRKDGSRVPVWSSHAVVRRAGKEPELFCIDVDLSELKYAENALRESDERFKNVFNDVLVGLYRTTPDGRILMANPALVRMLGYDSFEELANRNLEEESFEPRYFRSEFKERVDASGSVIGLEADWVRRDGTILSVRESAKAIRDELGNVLYYEGAVEDITERKRAEEELRRHRDHLEEMVAKRTHELERSNEELQAEIAERKQAEEALRETTDLLQTIFGHTHILVAYLDTQFNFVRVNRAYAEVDEREPSFFPGKNHFDLYPNKENEGIFRRVVETGIPYFAYAKPFEYAEHSERGITYWDWSLVPIKSQQGIVSGLVFTLADVTARKRAEESLKASEGKLNAMLQSVTDHMSMMDDNLTIIWANEKAKSIFGNDVVGRKCYEAYHGRNEPCEPYPCLTLKAFQDGKVHEHDTHVVDKDGNTRYFHCSANVALRDTEGKPTAVLEVSRDITDQMHVEQALRESESSYRAVVENAAEGIVVVQDQTLQFINPAILSMTGYSEEELLTRPFIEFVHPDHKEWAMELHLKRFKGEEVPPYELKVLDKKGNTIWLESNGILIEWRDKPATLNFLRDVTERRKAEQAIWASESEKRSILNAISDHIIFHDTDLTIRWCNEAAARSIGMTQRELVGCHCYELWQGRSVPCEGCPVLRSIETVSYNAGIMTTPDGKWWEIVGEPVLDRDGQIRGAIEISRDITERKKTEQTLRESEERLKILFESAPDTIYLIDSEGRFVDGNRAAFELIGFAKDEVIGKSLAEMDLLSAEQLSRAIANLKKATGNKLSGPNEYTLKRKDGSRVSIEVRTFPVKIGGKMLNLGIARDITEYKRTEKKLLEHQAKLKSLASQLSLTEERERHRLATDLHDQISQSLVISKIKLDQLSKSSTFDEFKSPLKDISNCLGQIIDDTRALTFDLSYPILYELGFEAAVSEWLTDQIQEKHQIEIEFEDDRRQKPLDDDIRVLLFRNVRELLINVIKHADANKVRVSICKEKEYINIRVEDDGVGFDPVEVTSMAAKRAEFGLFSIRERLEQLGGQIEINSGLGRGSKITMRAPLKYNKSTDRISK